MTKKKIVFFFLLKKRGDLVARGRSVYIVLQINMNDARARASLSLALMSNEPMIREGGTRGVAAP